MFDDKVHPLIPETFFKTLTPPAKEVDAQVRAEAKQRKPDLPESPMGGLFHGRKTGKGV